MKPVHLFSVAALVFGLSLAPLQAELQKNSKPDDQPDIHGTLVPHAAGVTLGAKDFTSELPENLRQAEVECRSTTIRVDKMVEFEVTVHYDQLLEHPNFFRRAEVTIPQQVPGVNVGVVFGFPTNLGSQDKPLMAVPFTLQWSGDRWLRGEQWTLYADGRLEKTE